MRLLVFVFIIFISVIYPLVSYSQVCGQRTMVNLVSSYDTCAPVDTCGITGTPYPGVLPSNCTGVINLSASGACLCTYTVCCADGVANYEDGTSLFYEIPLLSGADINATAQSIYDNNLVPISFPVPQAGYVMTGSLTGMVYSEEIGVDGTGILKWAGYKRGYYSLPDATSGTLSGTPVLSSGGGGGTSNGITAADLQAGITAGVDASALNPVGIITPPDLSGVDNSPIPSISGSYLTASSDLSTNFASFINNLKSTSLFSLPTSLTTGLPTGAGVSSVVSFSAGMYGNQSYDFSNWGGILLILRSIILLGFSYVGIRIVVLKK